MAAGVVEAQVPRVFPQADRLEKQVDTRFTRRISLVIPHELLDSDEMEDLTNAELSKMKMGGKERCGCAICLFLVHRVVN